MIEDTRINSQFLTTWSLFHDIDVKLLTMLNYLNDQDTVMDESMTSFIQLSLNMIKCEVSLVKACLDLVDSTDIANDPEAFCLQTFMTTEMLRDLKISYNKYLKFRVRFRQFSAN